jgi:cysteine desulfurase / selenocysteine lyase
MSTSNVGLPPNAPSAAGGNGAPSAPAHGSAPVLGVSRIATAPTLPESDLPTLTRLVSQFANEYYSGESIAAPVSEPAPALVSSPAPAPAPSAFGTASPFHCEPSFDSFLANPYAADSASQQFPLLDGHASNSTPRRDDYSVSNPSMVGPNFSSTKHEIDPTTTSEVRSNEGHFDARGLRHEFPILQQRVNGKPLVWLDNAATTQKPLTVIDRLTHFYKHENSNIHRAAHTLAARATDAYEGARESVRRFINAPSTKDIVVRGATEGINLVAQSWGRANIGAGDEIIVTHLEHHANIVPWQMLCAEKSARLRVAPVDDSGQIILSEYAKLLGPKTKLVALTQVSNALGTVTPAAAMVAMAKAAGARVLVDGAQAVSHMRVDVTALQCDFYVFSGHKVFAPTGIGAVYAPSALMDETPPWQGGGNMIADVTFERTVYQPAPARFEAGTGNIADAVGLGAALDWLTKVGIDNVSAYEHELLEYGTARLATVPGLKMIGTAPSKAGVMSFVLAGRNTVEIGGLLDKEGIAVRSGHHCAQPILRRFGLEATVRASLAPYNIHDDIDALVDALCRLQRR